MTIGAGGKYDPECEFVLAATGALGCAVIVCDGTKGSGFSVSLRAPFHASIALAMADALQRSADQIRSDATVLAGKAKG